MKQRQSAQRRRAEEREKLKRYELQYKNQEKRMKKLEEISTQLSLELSGKTDPNSVQHKQGSTSSVSDPQRQSTDHSTETQARPSWFGDPF